MGRWRLLWLLGGLWAFSNCIAPSSRGQTPTPTPTITVTPSATPTPTASGSPIPTPSVTPTASVPPTPSVTPSPSVVPTPSVTPGSSITPTPNPSATPGEALLDISTRGRAETGQNVLIGGFILGNGTANKAVVLRALGPSLGARGVVSPLADPSLQLFTSSGQLIGSNDNWMDDPNAQAVIDSGLAPTDVNEAALFIELAPGAYTVVVPGVDGTQNIALVEVYDLDSANTPQLLNISTRGFVDLGEGMMIAGTIVGGTTAKAIVVRGLGPSLATAGVTNFLPNPTITVFNATGIAVAANDDWQSDPSATDIQALGLAPTNTFEAATLVTLGPGNYTAILSDVNGSTNIGLVEIYNVTASF